MKRMTRLVTTGLLAWTANQVQAAGFALVEQNVSGLGNAYAGQAASAQDASTIFFNPAGMTYLSGRQAVVAGHAIRPSAKFADDGTTAAPLQGLGTGSEDAGGWALAPNFYYAMDLRPGVKFGLGVSPPFGLRTKYDSTWVGRFHAVKSDLKSLNINPALAFKLDDRWSVGVGLNVQQVKAILTNAVNYSALAGGALGANLEGLAVVEGDDWGWGYNLGALYSPAPDLRVGLHLRSDIKYTLEGDARFQNRPAALAAALPDGAVTAEVKLPGTASLSLFKGLNERWDLLADVTWTHWSVFENLTVKRTSGAVLSSTPENWRNAWRYSVGANYHASDRLTWRFGLALDESPVPDAFRTPRIPDADRLWLSVGAQYCPGKQRCLDLGYTHIFVDDARLANSSVGSGNLNGNYDNAVDILSIQYSHGF